MNRRSFISMLLAAAAAEAVDSAIPLNRVWSFPSQIVIPNREMIELTTIFYNRSSLDRLKANFKFEKFVDFQPLPRGGKLIQFVPYQPFHVV